MARTKENSKNVSVSGRRLQKITKKQAEIYRYIIKTGKGDTKTLSARFNCSSSNIRHHKRALKDAGYLQKTPRLDFRVEKEGGGAGKAEKKAEINRKRLHAIQWRIKGDFSRCRGYSVGSVFEFKENIVHVYEKYLVVIEKEPDKGGFIGQTDAEVLAFASRWYWRFFVALENRLGVSFLKPEKNNIELSKYEFATTDSALSKARDGKKHLLVFENGKLRFSTDKSRLHEHETHAPPKRDGFGDAESAERFLNPVLDYFKNREAVTYPQLVGLLASVLQTQADTGESVKALYDVLRLQYQKPEFPKEANPDFSYFL